MHESRRCEIAGRAAADTVRHAAPHDAMNAAS
jgi:hypothetical protein